MKNVWKQFIDKNLFIQFLVYITTTNHRATWRGRGDTKNSKPRYADVFLPKYEKKSTSNSWTNEISCAFRFGVPFRIFHQSRISKYYKVMKKFIIWQFILDHKISSRRFCYTNCTLRPSQHWIKIFENVIIGKIGNTLHKSMNSYILLWLLSFINVLVFSI